MLFFDATILRDFWQINLGMVAISDVKALYGVATFIIIAIYKNVYSTNHIDVATSKRACFAHSHSAMMLHDALISKRC